MNSYFVRFFGLMCLAVPPYGTIPGFELWGLGVQAVGLAGLVWMAVETVRRK